MYILSIPRISSSEMLFSERFIVPFTILGLAVFLITSGCSSISFIIKCSYPPFSAAFSSHVTFVISFSMGSPYESVTVTPSRVSTASSPSDSLNTRRVYFKIAVTSDAIKFSPSPIPIMRGLSLQIA